MSNFRERLSVVVRFFETRFFSSIEFIGLEHIPPLGTPLIYACNHKGGLMDPILLLTYFPRRPGFLAKRPLFEDIFISWGVRAFDSIPVYRASDGHDPKTQNIKSFEAAQGWLKQGHAIAIFPEGRSHSEPRVLPLKSGLARLALDSELPDLQIVPICVDYEDRESFGKAVKLRIGPAIRVSDVPPSEHERERIRSLTEMVSASLNALFNQLGQGGYPQARQPLWLKIIRFPALVVFAPFLGFSTWLSVKVAGAERDVIGTHKFLCLLFFGPPYVLLLFLGGSVWFGLKITTLSTLLLLFLAQLRVNSRHS